jgi:hypothetical protein
LFNWFHWLKRQGAGREVKGQRLRSVGLIGWVGIVRAFVKGNGGRNIAEEWRMTSVPFENKLAFGDTICKAGVRLYF